MKIMRIFLIFLLNLLVSPVWANICSEVFPDSNTSDSLFELNVPTWTSTDTLVRTGGSDTFVPGDFYYSAGDLSGGYQLVTSGVTTRLYFKSLTIRGGSIINPGGNPEDLIIVVDGPVAISGSSTINAIIYATEVSILSGARFTFTGSITSEEDIVFNGNNAVSYDPEAIENADFADLCSNMPLPIAYFSFNNNLGFTIPDESGNGHTGNLGINSTTDGDEPAGTCGLYLTFDGNNDLVNVPDDNELDLPDEFTVAAWIRPERYPSSGLMTILSKDENYEFHINTNGKLNWWWRNDPDDWWVLSRTRQFNSDTTIPLGQWTHVAITYSRSSAQQIMYINGVADASRSYDESTQVNNDPLQIGSDQFYSGRYFDGDIDEVYVFDQALKQRHIDTLVQDVPQECLSIDHLEIDVSSTSASTCAPIQVTVIACEDNLTPCTRVEDFDDPVELSISSIRGSWTINNADGTLTNGADNDGDALYQFVETDNGEAVLDLSYIFEDDIVIRVDDGVNGLVALSDVVSFSNNAFLAEWQDTLHTGATTSDTLAVAGRNHQMKLSYIRRDVLNDNCGVVTEYTGSQHLKVWYNDNGAYSVTPLAPGMISNAGALASLPSSEPSGTNLPVTFNSGIASVDVTSSDVGQFTLSFKDVSGFARDENDPPNPVDISGNSSTVTVRPFGFSLDTMADASSANCASPGLRAQNVTGTNYATDQNGSKYVAAGSEFDLVARAVLWSATDDANDDGTPDSLSSLYDNTCAPSFGKENTVETFTVMVQNFRPGTGSNGLLGGLASQNITGFNSGLAHITTDYDEVGIVDLVGQLTSGNYLSAGANVFGELLNVGRFYPHHFSVTSNTPVLNNAMGWTCDFTYQGQMFNFLSDIELTLQPLEAGGSVTEKYDGDYYKLGIPNPVASFTNGASGAVAVLTDYTTAASSAVSGLGDYDGQFTVTFSEYQLAYDKGATQPVAADAPFDAMVSWILGADALKDVDGACVGDPTNCADVMVSDISGTEIRFGRATVGNNNGSEFMPLELPLRVEHWMDVSASGAVSRFDFITNTDDSCSDDDYGGGAWATSDVTLSDYKGLSAGDTTGSYVGFSNGVGVLRLSAPGANKQGSVNATFDVDAWLHYDFYGRGEEDPTGTGTFGIYSGRPPIFYMRESYR